MFILSRMSKNEAGVISKLDLEKAYDHVSWVFLVELMKSVAFGICFWCSTVYRCFDYYIS